MSIEVSIVADVAVGSGAPGSKHSNERSMYLHKLSLAAENGADQDALQQFWSQQSLRQVRGKTHYY